MGLRVESAGARPGEDGRSAGTDVADNEAHQGHVRLEAVPHQTRRAAVFTLGVRDLARWRIVTPI